MSEIKQVTEAESVAKIVHDSVNRIVPESAIKAALDGSRLLVFQNKELLDLDQYAPNPRRKKGLVNFISTDSFIHYVKAHSIEKQTMILGCLTDTGASYKAILDYTSTEEAPAGRGHHVANLTLAYSPEWIRWTKANRQPMSVEAFSEWFRDNGRDVSKPSAGELMDMVRGLDVTKNVQFKSAMNLKTGENHLVYHETVEARGNGGMTVQNTAEKEMDIPDSFELFLRVFQGEEKIFQQCHLRFRLEGNRLNLFYVMQAPHLVVDDVALKSKEAIEKGTGLPVLLGSLG